MKKHLFVIFALILAISAVLFFLCSTASAKSVTQQVYELTIEGNEPRIGEYTGEMIDGVPDGYGIFVTTSEMGSKWHYIGNWKDGLMHGEGATYWDDGSLEIGEYENGRFIFGYFSYEGVDLDLYSEKPIDRSAVEIIIDPEPDDPIPVDPEVQYIGNKNSHVFHRLDCESVQKMKDKNKIEFYSRQDAIDLGYHPCDRCKP